MADSASSKSTFNLTPREQEVVVVALKNLKGGEISIDYEGMAAGLGLKDKASARASWCSVKKKLFGEPGSPAASSDVPATPAKAKAPRKTKDPNAPSAPKSTKKAAKSAVTVSDDANDGAEVPDNGDASVEVATPSTPTTVTPKKRGRKSKAEKDAEAAAAKDSALDGDDQEDNKPVKKARKTPVKKSAAVAKTDGTNVANDDTGTKEAPPSEEAKKAKRAEQDACAAEANEVLTGKKEVTPTDTSSEADASDSAKQSTTPEGQAEIVIDDDDSA